MVSTSVEPSRARGKADRCERQARAAGGNKARSWRRRSSARRRAAGRAGPGPSAARRPGSRSGRRCGSGPTANNRSRRRRPTTRTRAPLGPRASAVSIRAAPPPGALTSRSVPSASNPREVRRMALAIAVAIGPKRRAPRRLPAGRSARRSRSAPARRCWPHNRRPARQRRSPRRADIALEPRAVGEDRAEPRALRREVDVAARRFGIADEGQIAVRARRGRCRRRSTTGRPSAPLPSKLANASLNQVSSSRRGATRAIRLCGQLKRVALSGPTACGRRARIATASEARIPTSSAFARDQPRARRGEPALEPAGQIARALDRDSQRAVAAGQRDRRVGQIDRHIGKAKRLAARRRQAACRPGPS